MQNVETTPAAAPTRPDRAALAAAEVTATGPGFWDRALLSLLRWDMEKAAWAALLIMTVLSRLIGLGDRAMSHDESLHTVYSWQLYDGQGYKHDPMMHGPLKFHLTALAYFLFGVNDWSSRLEVALFGIAMVWLAWLLRPWLGKVGAFLVGLMFAISPALLYHSRYIRDEVMLCALLVALAIGMFRYIETRQAKWLYLTALSLALALITMEASFIFGGVFGGFLVLALAAELWRSSWPVAENRYPFRLAVSLAGPALAAGVLFLVMIMIVAPPPPAGTTVAAGADNGRQMFSMVAFAFSGIGAVAALAAAFLALRGWGLARLRIFPELDLIVLLGTLVLPFLAGALVKPLFKWNVEQFSSGGVPVNASSMIQTAALLIPLFALSIAIGYFWLRDRWVYAAGMFWAIELLFFTTFLTNGAGVVSGLIGSLGYWIAQQAVQRGTQPWFFFYRLVPLYEFLPMLLSIGGAVAWLMGKARYQAVERGGVEEQRSGGVEEQGGRGPSTGSTGSPTGSGTAKERSRSGFGEPALAGATSGGAGLVEARAMSDGPAGAARTARAGGERSGKGGTAAAAAEPVRLLDVRTLFVAFTVFWSVATWLVFTYVGEKMAWHVVYFATSMALLGGWWLGRVIDGIDWRAVRARGGFWFMLLVPLFLVALHEIFPPADRRPFQNVTQAGLSNTAGWVLALVVGLVLAYLLWERVAALGAGQSWRLTALSLSILLVLATAAVAYRFAFIDYDYATEPMVYAHGTPDLKLAMGQLDEISRKTAGDHSIKVAYDDDSTWPLQWYLRDYPNKAYYGAEPTRQALDAPVVIVGDKNYSKVKPYLGNNYYEFKYRLVWWPRETYKDLTFQKLWDQVRDPVARGQFWDVVLRRQWTLPTSQWDPAHYFSFFVRKDVAAQVWDWGAPAPAAGAPQGDPYAGGQRTVQSVQQLGGVAGAGQGQLSLPRAVAVGPDGTTYVADSGNNRIVVFGPDGKFLRQWGSTCKLYDKTLQGCQGDGRGQFNEPWGVAVDGSGNVYVSDTWNSRVQKFDSQGNFLTMWGVFDSTQGTLGNTQALYGPRQIIIGRDGNLYVTDTGNKRIIAFKTDGTFVMQFGGGGLDDGHFEEPTGITQDQNGNLYVADTWNHRIQKFKSDGSYLAQWPINGWASETVVNKPALAIDPTRNVIYATDPENFRVLAFGLDGSFKATWGQYGSEPSSLMMPTGISVGPDGKVCVADGDANRVLVFPPLQ